MREMIAPQSSLDANPKAKLLPIEKLISNPFQVRQGFDTPEANAALEELAADISEHGILQPILVRPAREPGKFEIVAGNGVTGPPRLLRYNSSRQSSKILAMKKPDSSP